ncbi:MAG: FAD-dependent oxidoreductase [Polyangiaceae bacterium]|nr:FAD-dependent oxidoreductase [Polyangiaceae bacterium]
MTTRREILTLLVGAPLAAEACRRGDSSVPGRFLGSSPEVGHLLRSGAVQAPLSQSKPVEVEVAIVGSGPSGLSAAWRLDQLGLRDFQVLELEPWLGGTSTSGISAVSPYPWGAHYVPLPGAENHALRRLLQEVGALNDQGEPSERALIREPEDRLFFEGSWHEGIFPAEGASAQDLQQLRAFEEEVQKWVRYRDPENRRAFAIPLAQAAESPELTRLDQTSAADFCTAHGFNSERLLWYLNYCCRDDYGATLEGVSAWALIFYFAARMQAPGGSTRPFLTWPEGNGKLVKHLAARAGKRVKPRQMVLRVSADATSVTLEVLDVLKNQRYLLRARSAILAIPQFVIARMWEPFRSAAPEYLRQFKYSSWLVANLHLRARPKGRGFPLAWDNVLYESPSVGYVVATHQGLSDFGPTVFTYYLPLTNLDLAAERHKLLKLDHATACDAILADLERAHPNLRELVDHIDVWRWGHAMIRPSVGFWSSSGRRRAGQLHARVFAAHSDLSGIALFEEAQYRGVVAAESAARLGPRQVDPLYG